ncbi:MAG: Uma2 family endonuclease [Phormidium tanganyikae FI6-MK23]|jgi:Uma2 family endonuclease|nr:Uma2 family endonuclease [Phormidium tanganyikae FI6-MK23]
MNTPLSKVPPLENGDRLSRPEFERRYAADPHIKKAELIEGTVYVASPLRHRQHGKPHSRIQTWIGFYQAMTPGIDLSTEPIVRMDLDNEPQPDVVLFFERGGGITIAGDGYLEGAPELVIEIAGSSAAIDAGTKKQVYRRNGIQEYILWQSYENRLDWFQLVEGEYQLLLPDEAGVIRSQVFPGLWLSVDDLLSYNMTKVLETVQARIRSPEHQAFIEARQ